MWRNVLGYDGTCGNYRVMPDGDTRQDDGIGSNPDVVFYHDRLRTDALFVNPFLGLKNALDALKPQGLPAVIILEP